MKNLILIRHGKSSWEHNLKDHLRPLKKRGQTDAVLISNKIKELALVEPDLILISDATRTIETAQIIVDELNWESRPNSLVSELYDFSGEATFNVITSCSDAVSNLVIIGHNPTLSIIASQIGSEFIENIPTCGVVVIQFNTNSWDNLKNGETIQTIFPRDLK